MNRLKNFFELSSFTPFHIFTCSSSLAFLIAVPWFLLVPLHLDTFAGDDLGLWQAQKAGTYSSTVYQALTETGAEKYRPVASLFYLATYRVFRDNFHGYIILNLLLHCFFAAIIGVLISRMCNWKYLPALVFCILFTTSRFAYYNVLQRTGLMESCAFFLFVLTLAFAVNFYNTGRIRSGVAALLAFLLCIHTHERYMVIFPFLSLTYIFASVESRKVRYGLAIMPALIVLLNFLEKTYLLHIHFLTGTGGEHIALNPRTIAGFMMSGFASIVGFNTGPGYLSGVDFRDLGYRGILPGVLVSLASAMVVVTYLLNLRKKLAPSVLLFLALGGSLLMTASITFRQEFRWLFAPDVVWVMALLLMADKFWDRAFWGRIVRIAVVLFFIGGVWVNVIVRQHLNNLYFMGGWLADAENTRSVIVDGFRNQLGKRAIYTIDQSIDPAFITAYSGIKNLTIIPVSSRALGLLSKKEIQTGLFFAKAGGSWQLVNVSPEARTSGSVRAVTANDIELMPELRDPLQKSPGSWYYTMQVGQILMRHNPDKAEYYLKEAIRLVGTGNPYPYFDLGQLFQQEGRLEQAEEYYKLAVQYDDPKHPNPGLKNAVTAIAAAIQDAKGKYR